MTLKRRTKNEEQRTGGLPAASSGIALVMVLGILSVMVIMAVAFAIAMRTERVAAGNYADSVRARQLVQVGIARALDRLVDVTQSGLGTNGLSSSGLPSPLVYPFWSVLSSCDMTYTNTSKNVYLLYATNDSLRANEATNYVPRALWSAATNVDYDAATNHWDWVLIESVVGNPPTTNLIGRVKYLILNCSGLLDANFVGGAARGVGTNPTELAISNMPEIANAGTFTNNRAANCRYETLEELAVLNQTNFNGFPSNFIVYSHALPGYWDINSVPGVRTQVNLSGTEVDIDGRRIPITNALINIGFSSSEAYVIWRNLMDYVDADSIHTDSYASVESVPMINEIVVSNVVTAVGGGSNRMDTTIYFELWYPFVQGSADNFDIQYAASFTDLTAPPSGFAPANVVAWRSLLPNVATPGAQSFAVRSDSLPSITNAAGSVDFMSTITARVVLVVGGAEVDQVNGINIRNINNPPIGINIIGSECLDPRFNWYLTQWQQTNVVTLSNINNWTSSYLASPTNSGDTNTEMYVANRPLQSVAELGYLVYSSNAPWHTVKLYGTNLHRVLDVFGLSTNTSDIITNTTVYRGLVNPNSSETNALAMAFADMPVDEYPGGPSNRLSMPSALTIAGRLYAGRFYTNLSDIGRGLIDFSGLRDTTGTLIPFSNELQKESIFRNTCGLLSVRQNLFTIIIEADVASGGNIPRNPVKQRAVALVWRDPYTGEMFVRSIKWLKD